MYAGYVLAGGGSTRMGTDKALLQLDGEALITRVARAVQEAAGSCAILGNVAHYGRFGYPVIADRVPGCGPLGGIHAALAHTGAPWNLIVACDMPGIHAMGVGELARECQKYPEDDVLIPFVDGQPEPLCAMYHIRALPAIERSLLAGRLKIMDALKGLRVVRLSSADESLFANCNTPEEWTAVSGR